MAIPYRTLYIVVSRSNLALQYEIICKKEHVQCMIRSRGSRDPTVAIWINTGVQVSYLFTEYGVYMEYLRTNKHRLTLFTIHLFFLAIVLHPCYEIAAAVDSMYSVLRIS